jgi:GNAT superfamily N-acetyltransferase
MDMNEPVQLTSADASQIAAFTRVACPFDLLSTGSVERGLFYDPDAPLTVLGVFDGGLDAIAASVVRGPNAWVKFLAVHPRVRLGGFGTALLERLEDFARTNGATHMHVGNSAPFFVVPGVDPRSTETVCFFEQRGYRRSGDAVNQRVSLTGLAEPSLPCRTAGPAELDAIMPWVREHYPHWIAELTRAVELGTCVVHDDLGFACYDVLRDAWFGPMATRPDLRGKRGVGSATLLTALHQMRARGYEHADIVWSGPLLFYLKTVGARVNRVFWWFTKAL